MSQTPVSVDPTTVNVADVQGDIILGFPKKKEEFVFFVIQDAAKFQEALPRLKITSTADVIEARGKIAEVKQQASGALVPLAFLNIAFSQKGLDALGITDALGDDPFANGQLKFAKDLGDDGKLGPDGFEPSWEAAFKQRTDGVLVVAGESWKSTNITSAEAISTLGDSISVVYKLKGSVRPGDQKGHEHFGWEDGISNPVVQGVGDVNPGQRVVPPGVILCGMTGDPVTDRPDWAFGGSILAFRQLEQLVPEFSKFLIDNPIVLPGLTRKQGSELLGARLVGRWKSGAPIQLSPLHDDPELAADPKRNNNFVYPPQTDDEGQTACPFAAHIRKTNPRTDIPDRFVQASSIIRAGIPYGPEVQPTEKEECVSEFERGLAFVSYQSDLTKGFQFIQESWANIPKFPPKSVEPGFDPIIGQANGAARQTLGTQSGSTLTLPQDFVVSRGGEYFFSPSISALKGKFSGQ